MKMGWMEKDLNAITLVVSHPKTEQPGLASDGKKNHISTQAATRAHPYPFPMCLSYLGFVCGGVSGLQMRGSCWGVRTGCSSGPLFIAMFQTTTNLLATASRGMISTMV